MKAIVCILALALLLPSLVCAQGAYGRIINGTNQPNIFPVMISAKSVDNPNLYPVFSSFDQYGVYRMSLPRTGYYDFVAYYSIGNQSIQSVPARIYIYNQLNAISFRLHYNNINRTYILYRISEG